MIGWVFAWERVAQIIARRWKQPVVLVVAVALVAGCAAMGGLSKDSPAAAKESAVAERAKARWQAMIKRNYEEAYGYFSATSKNATTLAGFQAKVSPIQYRAVNIDKVECVIVSSTDAFEARAFLAANPSAQVMPRRLGAAQIYVILNARETA